MCILFLQEQIQSFSHLGVCKEYLTMARQKSPKKNNDLNPTVSIPNTPSAAALNGALAEVAAAPKAAPEVRSIEMKNSTQRKSARKLEVAKTDSRPTVMPINLEDEIRSLAYLISERRGFEAGHETEDWLAAEREVLQRYVQHSA
jgi:hypothetical protein